MNSSRKPDLARVVRGRMVHVYRRRGFVEALVYAGPVAEGEPLAEWEMPNQLRYNLDAVALTAEAQTEPTTAASAALPAEGITSA